MATLERSFPMGEGSGTAWSAGQTGYQNWCGFYVAETNAQVPFPKCRAKKIALRVITNTSNGETVVTLRKNGAGTALTFTIGAGATGLFTNTGDILVEDGDLICYEIAIGGTTGGVSFAGGSVKYV